MARVCQYSGKKTRAGRTYTTRGLAKSKGGVGKKITGKTNRTFKPNVQRVRALVDGRVVRVKIAAKYLRRGVVEKPIPRARQRASA
jgi:large subunit ribosomal protein L28